MNYEIEDGIVLPAHARHTGCAKYPWKQMRVDQSFFVSTADAKNIYSNISHANKAYAPRRYKGKTAEKDGIRGVRVWRVE